MRDGLQDDLRDDLVGLDDLGAAAAGDLGDVLVRRQHDLGGDAQAVGFSLRVAGG